MLPNYDIHINLPNFISWTYKDMFENFQGMETPLRVNYMDVVLDMPSSSSGYDISSVAFVCLNFLRLDLICKS